jgi:two-component system, OmpR family, sensor histidine kinase KdpD
LETHGRKGTEALVGELPMVPRQTLTYRGTVFEELDTEEVLRRRPQWALVDELAHSNVPGSARTKRWEDVEVLLSAGISVLSTLNVQHLESLNDTVFEITGVRMRETLPDKVLQDADEVQMIDITPRALVNRLERGDIYQAEKIEQAKSNWFREGNLSALREIALREIAQEVDDELECYRRERRIAQPWATHDRILVCLSPTQSSLRLLRRGWRMARRLKGEVVAVYVESREPSATERAILQADFTLADQLQIPVETVVGSDIARELVRYAREKSITQLIVGHSDRSRFQELLQGNIINRLTRELRSIDLLIVANSQQATLTP